MHTVISVIGKDRVGILARVSGICAKHEVNVTDVTQSVTENLFAMIMLVDISKCDVPFSCFADELTEAGKEMGISIHTVHEDIYNSMHHI
jgi:ACT domain-containing protein